MSPSSRKSGLTKGKFKAKVTFDVEHKTGVKLEDMVPRLAGLSENATVLSIIAVAAQLSLIKNIKVRFDRADFGMETEGFEARDRDKLDEKSGSKARGESGFTKQGRVLELLQMKYIGPKRVYFGPIKKLDQEETGKKKPWAPVGVGEQIDSENTPNILWRQLEFGTGIYAKPRRRLVGRRPIPKEFEENRTLTDSQMPTTKEPWLDGSWRFGKTRVMGSRPGDFLPRKVGEENWRPGEREAFDLQLARRIEAWLRTGTYGSSE